MAKSKIFYNFDTLKRIARDLKRQDKIIGLTHGAFDLFHYSHLDLLRKSAKLCDFLIVGIDSDRNVSKYKSYKRPIFSQDIRATIVNELHSVDAVFVYDGELKPEVYTNLYKELLIDCVMIGKHFSFQNVINYQVGKAGAQLITVNTYQSPSTTSIINNIVSRYSR